MHKTDSILLIFINKTKPTINMFPQVSSRPGTKAGEKIEQNSPLDISDLA